MLQLVFVFPSGLIVLIPNALPRKIDISAFGRRLHSSHLILLLVFAGQALLHSRRLVLDRMLCSSAVVVIGGFRGFEGKAGIIGPVVLKSSHDRISYK